jgi:hypothetical protein
MGIKIAEQNSDSSIILNFATAIRAYNVVGHHHAMAFHEIQPEMKAHQFHFVGKWRPSNPSKYINALKEPFPKSVKPGFVQINRVKETHHCHPIRSTPAAAMENATKTTEIDASATPRRKPIQSLADRSKMWCVSVLMFPTVPLWVRREINLGVNYPQRKSPNRDF